LVENPIELHSKGDFKEIVYGNDFRQGLSSSKALSLEDRDMVTTFGMT